MAINRSLTQQEFDADCQAIESSRDFETGLFVSMDFISAASSSLVLVDMAQLMGASVSITLGLSFASFVFFGLLGITALGGIACAVHVVREGINKKNEEIGLMAACFALQQKKASKLTQLKTLLAKLLAIKEDDYIRDSYNKIVSNNNVENTTREINGYIKNKMQKNFPDIVRANKLKQETVVSSKKPYDNHIASQVIAFFSGFGFMLGVSATVIGAAVLPALLTNPVGWVILATVLVLSIAAGAVMSYVDYRMRQSQETHIEALQDEERNSFVANKRLDKLALRIESYSIVMSLQKDCSPAAVIVPVERASELQQIPQMDTSSPVALFAVGERASELLQIPQETSGPASGLNK